MEYLIDKRNIGSTNIGQYVGSLLISKNNTNMLMLAVIVTSQACDKQMLSHKTNKPINFTCSLSIIYGTRNRVNKI